MNQTEEQIDGIEENRMSRANTGNSRRARATVTAGEHVPAQPAAQQQHSS